MINAWRWGKGLFREFLILLVFAAGGYIIAGAWNYAIKPIIKPDVKDFPITICRSEFSESGYGLFLRSQDTVFALLNNGYEIQPTFKDCKTSEDTVLWASYKYVKRHILGIILPQTSRWELRDPMHGPMADTSLDSEVISILRQAPDNFDEYKAHFEVYKAKRDKYALRASGIDRYLLPDFSKRLYVPWIAIIAYALVFFVRLFRFFDSLRMGQIYRK